MPENRQRRKEKKEVVQVEIAPGMAVESLDFTEPRRLNRPKGSRNGVGCADRGA